MHLASSTSIGVGIAAALFSALLMGLGDFGSGELGKKISPMVFLAGIYVIEIPFLFLAMFVTNEFGLLETNLWLFAIGLLGTFGYVSIIFGLSHGQASIVMALAGLLALVVPTVASVLLGENASWLVWTGVVVAVIAILCVTNVSEPEHEDDKISHSRTVRISIITGTFGGLFTGVYFVGLDKVESPIFSKLFFLQLSGFIIGAIYIFMKQKSVKPIRKFSGFILLLATAYQISQMLFPFASDRTSLVTTNILVNLYPAVTIAMAKIVNNEKTNRIQNLGFLLAVIGVVAVSFGATL